MRKYFQIAIDGPVAAGKSTVARELSKRLGFVYVDTGAMYRAVTLAAQRAGVGLDDEAGLTRLVEALDIDVRMPVGDELDGRLSTVLLAGEDVSWQIRAPEVSAGVAVVAAKQKVREVLVGKQRKIAEDRDVVMEGRDITYVVLPHADLKIFLSASEEVRVLRYYTMLTQKNSEISMEEARELLVARDKLDTTRETSPLKVVADAWVVDTSTMSIEEVVETIAERVFVLRK